MTRLPFIPPMTPTLIDRPPTGDGWSTEVKFDGWRCQIIIDAEGVRVFTRRGHDWTSQLRLIADAARSEIKAGSAILDGEIVYPHESGASDFHTLQAVIRSQSDALIFMAFDLLHLDGVDLRREAAEHRRGRLGGRIRPGGRIQYSESLAGTPAALFASVERMGLEGIVCKRRDSAYRSGPSRDWIKVKCFIESDLEILGVQRAEGKPTMAIMSEIGSRAYMGSAFVTFGRADAEKFWRLVEASSGAPPREFKDKAGTTHWQRPGIVGRVKHLRNEDKLRHARLVSVQGVRHD